jgi:hypothetical protein
MKSNALKHKRIVDGSTYATGVGNLDTKGKTVNKK